MSHYATISTTSMDMSPVVVTYNSVDLGGTLSNVTIDFKYMKGEVHADQMGLSVIDRIVNGFEVKVTTEIAEIKNKDTWDKLFPNATLITAGGVKTIHFEDKITTKDVGQAFALKLSPISSASGDVNFDYTFAKAVPSEESSIVYGPGEQQKLKIVWNIYPDMSTTPPSWFKYGDTSI